MKLRDVNIVSSMQKIYIPPTIIKQVLEAISNLDIYIENQNIPQFSKNIQSHIEIEGNVHNVQLSESELRKLLTKLYLEWKQKYPSHDYDTFLKTLVDEYNYFYTLIPDNLTSEQKTKYLITICALVYYFNKIHGISDIAHNGLFDEYITKIQDNIINNNKYIKDVYFYFNVFNTIGFTKTMDNDLNTLIDEYYTYKQEYQQQNINSINQYLLGIPSLYESLDYLIDQYQTLLDWQYNWEYRRTIGLMSIFTIENFPYYQPVYVKDKLVFNSNTELFLNFTYVNCKGITHLFTIRDSNGKLILSLYADNRDNTIYIVIHDNTQLNIYPLITIDSSITNYKVTLRTLNYNRTLQCNIMLDNLTNTYQTFEFNNLPLLPYFPEYINIPFKFDVENKVKYNSYHELLAYDRIKYPYLHNQLFGID